LTKPARRTLSKADAMHLVVNASVTGFGYRRHHSIPVKLVSSSHLVTLSQTSALTSTITGMCK